MMMFHSQSLFQPPKRTTIVLSPFMGSHTLFPGGHPTLLSAHAAWQGCPSRHNPIPLAVIHAGCVPELS